MPTLKDLLIGWLGASPTKMAPVPVTAQEVAARASKFPYIHTWKCACGSNLRIRSSVPRAEGPSNFVPDDRGHSQLPSSLLTWEGLANERGWDVNPTVCPACVLGMSRVELRRRRQEALLVRSRYGR